VRIEESKEIDIDIQKYVSLSLFLPQKRIGVSGKLRNKSSSFDDRGHTHTHMLSHTRCVSMRVGVDI
jgi:hypothetical protein